MGQVLIIVTSGTNKSERIYTGSVEWSDGWKLDDRAVAFRKRNDNQIHYADGLAAMVLTCDQDCIIWIKGKKAPDGVQQSEGKEYFQPDEVEHLNRFIKDISVKCEVYFAYHDPFVEFLLTPESRSRLKRLKLYGLPKESKQFRRIVKQEGDQRYLDNLADFDELFKAFFVNPVDIFPLLRHKLVGMLSSIDMDLQVLRDTNFDQTQWEELIPEYRAGKGHEMLEQFRYLIYGNDYSSSDLKRLYKQEEKVQSGDRSRQIRRLWSKLNALIPEDPSARVTGEFQSSLWLYNQVLKVLDRLRDRDKQQVSECFQDGNRFRQWLDELNLTVADLEKVISPKQSTSTDV